MDWIHCRTNFGLDWTVSDESISYSARDEADDIRILKLRPFSDVTGQINDRKDHTVFSPINIERSKLKQNGERHRVSLVESRKASKYARFDPERSRSMFDLRSRDLEVNLGQNR